MNTYEKLRGRPGRLQRRVMGQGPEVVLIHGWGFHGEIWSEVQRVLACRYRVTAVDLPGHGRSKHLRLGSLDDVAQRLCEEIDGAAIWIGWSLGALVAMAIASRDPARALSVVAVAGTPRFVCSPEWPHALQPEVLDGFAGELRGHFRRTLTRFLALQMRGVETGNTDLRGLRTLLFAHPPDPEALQDGLRILREADMRPCLSELSCPLHFILGERDALIPVAVADDLGEGRATVVRGAGHVPFLSHPAEFLRQLDEALDVRSQSSPAR